MNYLDILAEIQKLAVDHACEDSRRIGQGGLFFAWSDDAIERNKYIAQAVARGASAVVWQTNSEAGNATGAYHENATIEAISAIAAKPENPEKPKNSTKPDNAANPANPVIPCPNWSCSDLRQSAGMLAHAVLGAPSNHLSLIAITGTNGKTSISQWLAQVYPASCAVIGTLGAGLSGQLVPTGFTTPEAPTLATLLAQMLRQGAEACALEASSIGIAEGRLNGCQVDVAIFTNLTQDHLDYHGDMAHYAEAKARLFHWPQLRLAIINADEEFGRSLITNNSAQTVIATTSRDQQLPNMKSGDDRNTTRLKLLSAAEIQFLASGTQFTLNWQGQQAIVRSAVLGHYNIDNMLAVAAVLLDKGVALDEVADKLSSLLPPPGRLESVCTDANAALVSLVPLVVVDYAHTPDALANVLVTLRAVATSRAGKLLVVFGCGGNRDTGKRPLMGRAAGQVADRIWLTSDNPRDELPMAILSAIESGVLAVVAETARQVDYVVEADRKKAIFAAIATADHADVVLVAGKGHETTQEIAGVCYPFCDRLVCAEAIREYFSSN